MAPTPTRPRRRRLMTGRVWPAIMAARPRGIVTAVISYVTKGGLQLLRLRRGDTLITNASIMSVRAGNTDPSALDALRQLGVALFSVENLHAKILIYPR